MRIHGNRLGIEYGLHFFTESAIDLNEIYGLDIPKSVIKDKIINNNEEIHKNFLFYGLPGTGKDMIAHSLVHEINAKACLVDTQKLINHSDKEIETIIHFLFSQGSKFHNFIIYFDHVDSAFVNKHSGELFKKTLLKEMFEKVDFQGETPFVIFSSSNPWNIDDELLKEGRFLNVYFDLPNEKTREKIVLDWLKKMQTIGKDEFELDVSKMVAATANCNVREIKNLLKTAEDIAFLRYFEEKKLYISKSEADNIFYNVIPCLELEAINRIEHWKNR